MRRRNHRRVNCDEVRSGVSTYKGLSSNVQIRNFEGLEIVAIGLKVACGFLCLLEKT